MVTPDWRKGWTLPQPDCRDTACGNLRVERYIGLWEGGPPGRWDPTGRLGRWSNLIDLKTDNVLLDSSKFETSEFRWREDGALLFWMKNRTSEGMFSIDPSSGMFRSLSTDEPAQPLSELSAAVHADYDRIVVAKPPDDCVYDRERPLRLEKRFTPCGQARLDILIWRSGRDDEQEAPRVVSTKNNKILLDFWPEWDCLLNLYSDQLFYLDLLRPRFKATLNIRPDLDSVRISFVSDETLLPHVDGVPFDQVRPIVEEQYKLHCERNISPLHNGGS